MTGKNFSTGEKVFIIFRQRITPATVTIGGHYPRVSPDGWCRADGQPLEVDHHRDFMHRTREEAAEAHQAYLDGVVAKHLKSAEKAKAKADRFKAHAAKLAAQQAIKAEG